MLYTIFYVGTLLEIQKGKEGPTTTFKRGPTFVSMCCRHKSRPRQDNDLMNYK
jgi:hypothetical protein